MAHSSTMVSICCMTYNQEKYIAETIEGFLKQKTGFEYEILIHDDASTDSTQSIIKKYAKNYPERIKLVIQEENQYSKGVDIVKEYLYPLVSGKYVAICEGDDFWIDENKLQKQIDILEENNSVNMCVHATQEIFEDGSITGKIYPCSEITSGIVKSKVLYSLPYSFHTSSYVFRAKAWLKYMENSPMFKEICDVGDEPDLLFFGRDDGVYYLDDVMSSYRRGVAGSWTSMQARTVNSEKIIKHADIMIETYKLFDNFSEYKYHSLMVKKISVCMLRSTTLSKRVRTFFKPSNREYFNSLNLTKKIIVCLATVFPVIVQKWYKNKLRKAYERNGY